ncbi:DUF2326 domain-containing protein [Thomasclavelia sp.]
MYIKKLVISSRHGIIRDINFNDGLNLIVDETKEKADTSTGNNVGKTTVLKLIYFCFGGDAKEIYTSEENSKDEYLLIKEYLKSEEILITLVLKADLREIDSKEIKIERNFLRGKKKITKINGNDYNKDDYVIKLKSLLFTDLNADKPTLKQIVGHNIRYKNSSINNTLKYFSGYTSATEYETLHLYLLGCSHLRGKEKEKYMLQLTQEKNYKKRLESNRSKNAYSLMLAEIENEINKLENKKNSLNINENFENELSKLNNIKFDINHLTETLATLNIRKNLIEESKKELQKDSVDVDINELKNLYKEAKVNLEVVTKTFDELVQYHNKMIENKVSYITKDLPRLEEKIKQFKNALNEKLSEEKRISKKLKKSDTFSDLEEIILLLNAQYQKKGECESILAKISESEENLDSIEKNIEKINNEIMSTEFQEDVKRQVTEFNKHFASISEYLYGEKYLLTYEIKETKKNHQKYYEFSTFNANMSSGKKQGEILCFDIAIIKFLRELKIDHLSFLLNDKKELMDNNQLIKVSKYAKENRIQLVFSMLADKIPEELNNDENVILRLSQSDKLFKIE